VRAGSRRRRAALARVIRVTGQESVVPAGRARGVRLLVVDAANVVGSRPDGWWRDRAGAAARLVAGIRALAPLAPYDEVVVVLEGRARPGAPEGKGQGVTVVHAPGEGDDEIVRQASRPEDEVTVVTADRGLRDRLAAVGAAAVGPSWLRDRL
jgi:hypothetical protein